MCAEPGEEALFVALEEERIEIDREAALVAREKGAFDPLDHLAPRREGVAVDIQADLLASITERVEQGRILLRLEGGFRRGHIAAQRVREGGLRGDLRGDRVGGV